MTERLQTKRTARAKEAKRAVSDKAEARLQELRKQIADVNQAAAAEAEGIDTALLRDYRILQLELGRDSFQALQPLVRDWTKQPTRELAEAIRIELDGMLERESNECPRSTGPAASAEHLRAPGLALSQPLAALAVLFAEQVAGRLPVSVSEFAKNFERWGAGAGQGGAIVAAASALSQCLTHQPIAFKNALEAFEACVEEIGKRAVYRGAVVETCHVDRFKLLRRLDPRALDEHDAALEGAALDERRRTHKMPDPVYRPQGQPRMPLG